MENGRWQQELRKREKQGGARSPREDVLRVFQAQPGGRAARPGWAKVRERVRALGDRNGSTLSWKFASCGAVHTRYRL